MMAGAGSLQPPLTETLAAGGISDSSNNFIVHDANVDCCGGVAADGVNAAHGAAALADAASGWADGGEADGTRRIPVKDVGVDAQTYVA